MPTFHYRALQSNGQIAEGQIEAGGRTEAFRAIEGQSLRPISLKEGVNGKRKNGAAKPAATAANGNGDSTATDGAAKSGKGFSFSSNKISARILENFTRLLSSLLAAGVPVSRALVILQKEAANPVAKAKWKEVHDYVVDGMTLADAMSKSPETFPKVYVAMVEAGETGGFLDVVLNQIADFQSREKEMRGKVMAALLYPAILLVLALGVVVFLLVFFIPRFQTLFSGFGAQLPLLTQIIVGVSEIVRSAGFSSARCSSMRATCRRFSTLVVSRYKRSWFVKIISPMRLLRPARSRWCFPACATSLARRPACIATGVSLTTTSICRRARTTG
jgi:type II secretory pathway component PulF